MRPFICTPPVHQAANHNCDEYVFILKMKAPETASSESAAGPFSILPHSRIAALCWPRCATVKSSGGENAFFFSLSLTDAHYVPPWDFMSYSDDSP